jgi:putative addiction module killer protein
MLDVVQYETRGGRCPFADWFNRLDAQAALKVRTAIARMEAGNPADSKSIGDGVWERRIDWGPGYRLYFGHDGRQLIVLLTGGTKQRQQTDITRARELWADYRERKKER